MPVRCGSSFSVTSIAVMVVLPVMSDGTIVLPLRRSRSILSSVPYLPEQRATVVQTCQYIISSISIVCKRSYRSLRCALILSPSSSSTARPQFSSCLPNIQSYLSQCYATLYAVGGCNTARSSDATAINARLSLDKQALVPRREALLAQVLMIGRSRGCKRAFTQGQHSILQPWIVAPPVR